MSSAGNRQQNANIRHEKRERGEKRKREGEREERGEGRRKQESKKARVQLGQTVEGWCKNKQTA